MKQLGLLFYFLMLLKTLIGILFLVMAIKFFINGANVLLISFLGMCSYCLLTFKISL